MGGMVQVWARLAQEFAQHASRWFGNCKGGFCLQGLFQPVKLFPFICVTLFVNASPFVGVSNGGLGAQFE